MFAPFFRPHVLISRIYYMQLLAVMSYILSVARRPLDAMLFVCTVLSMHALPVIYHWIARFLPLQRWDLSSCVVAVFITRR